MLNDTIQRQWTDNLPLVKYFTGWQNERHLFTCLNTKLKHLRTINKTKCKRKNLNDILDGILYRRGIIYQSEIIDYKLYERFTDCNMQ